MKKEYNKPEIEVISLNTDEIMATLNYSAANTNDKQIFWDWEDETIA